MGLKKENGGMVKISEGRKGGCQFVLDAIERLGRAKPVLSGHLRDLPKCPLRDGPLENKSTEKKYSRKGNL